MLILFKSGRLFGRLEYPVHRVLGGRRRDVQMLGDVAVRKKSGLKTHSEDPPLLRRKTTLAKMLLRKRKVRLYRNWDEPWLPVEVKQADTQPSENWRRFAKLLPCKRGLQIVYQPAWNAHAIGDMHILVAGAAEALHYFA